METRTYKVYKFNELDDDTKQSALENLADINVVHDWWDCMYEDAANVLLKLTEFDIDRGSYCKGDFIEYAEDTANKIITEHGKSCETWGTATNYIAERAELVKKYSDGIKTDIVAEDNEYDFDKDCEDIDAEFLRAILEDYRIMLQQEFEYMTSEKAIIETIEANDYDFTEDGKID